MIKHKQLRLCHSSELDLRKTFACGQCFRWNRLPEPRDAARDSVRDTASHSHEISGTRKDSASHSHPRPTYIGVCRDLLLLAEENEGDILVSSPLGRDIAPFASSIYHYFDTERDYAGVREELYLDAAKHQDAFLRSAVEYSRGLRLLRQDPFETLISFIISANNNIPKIKLTIEDLCRTFGTPIGEYEENTFYSFPTAEQLAGKRSEIERIRAVGYRARAIAEAAEKVAEGRIAPEHWTQKQMRFEDAVTLLRTLYGVGEKVANCVALFGLGHDAGFPVDTWIKKILRAEYGVERDFERFVRERFRVHPGIAQQYLFFYLRERTKIK